MTYSQVIVTFFLIILTIIISLVILIVVVEIFSFIIYGVLLRNVNPARTIYNF